MDYKLNKETLPSLTDEITNALAQVAAKHQGLSLKLSGKVTYAHDGLSFDAKLSGSIGTTEEQGKRSWENYAEAFGLPKDAYGKTIKSLGEEFTLAGIDPKKRTKSIIAVNEKGVRYAFDYQAVKRMLCQPAVEVL